MYYISYFFILHNVSYQFFILQYCLIAFTSLYYKLFYVNYFFLSHSFMSLSGTSFITHLLGIRHNTANVFPKSSYYLYYYRKRILLILKGCTFTEHLCHYIREPAAESLMESEVQASSGWLPRNCQRRLSALVDTKPSKLLRCN